MTDNLTPWLVLAAIVALTLVWKGYIRLPTSLSGGSNNKAIAVPIAVPMGYPPSNLENPARGAMSPALNDSDLLDGFSAWQLGIAFAKAAKREAEHGLAQNIANSHLNDMMATFQGPFSVPSAPPAAGQTPNQAVVNP